MSTTQSTSPKKAQITFPTDTEMVITRHFSAPRELVWRAYTEAEHVREWFGCDMMKMLEVTSDVRPGGRYRYVGQDAQAEHPFSGEYLEVEAPQRLVFTETYENVPGSEHRCELTLEEVDDGTLLTERLVYPSREARDGHVDSGMEHGIQQSYDGIERIAQCLAA